PLFVLLPLVLVLSWPALAAWGDGIPGERLSLQTPVVVGFGFVLLMGAGNYAGTRFTLPAFLYAAALLMLVVPFAEASDISSSPIPSRGSATLTLSAAAVSAWLCRRKGAAATRHPFDRLWTDFRDAFGMVWARRLQDRINAAAEKEQWPVRLGMDGFHGETGPGPPDRIAHTLRWLLRRFVDERWIDERLA
ncbi:MAG: hypothetical protein ACREIV_13025, partial [Planctomycetaceae bacterium]